MTENKQIELLRIAYRWGRDNGSNRSEKNFNDLLETEAIKKSLITDNAIIQFSYEELNHMLVMLTEGQKKINTRKAFEVLQNTKIQENIIEKVRIKCWEYHHNEL